MGICLDLSHWDYPTAGTLDQFRELAALGVSDVIIGGNPNYPNEARAQIQFARDAGMFVGATYAFLYFGLDIERRWARFNATLAAAENVPSVYLDCESNFYGPGDTRNTEAPNLTPSMRIAEFESCLRIVYGSGRAPGVYTNGWWRSKMANTTAYKFLPLWLAHWLSDTEFIPFDKSDADFGGWTVNAIHQFTSSYPGLIRDRRDANHIHDFESWFGMDVLSRLARLEKLVAGNGYGREPSTVPGEPGPVRLTGDAALEAADADGASLFLGLGDTQADVNRLKELEAEFSAIAPNVARD